MTTHPSLANICVLIVEDGNEYLDNLSRFVQGPVYKQAHNLAEALNHLSKGGVDLIYLDMRFDRTPRPELSGDIEQAARRHNGDVERAWKYLANNQGLFILEALKKNGFDTLPVILSYDFSSEQRRLENLTKLYPTLHWVPDAVTSEQIATLMMEVTGF